MKTPIIAFIAGWFLFFVAWSSFGFSQSEQEHTKNRLVQTAVNAQKSDITQKELQKIAGDLERIALTQPDDWHAQYYAAYAHVELAYRAKKREIDALCDRGEEFLDRAMEIRPRESENHVLKAYLLSARVHVNAMFRGASLGRLSKEELDLALELNQHNPRAHYVRAMGTYHTPAVFGGGKNKAKPQLEHALKVFLKNPPKTDLDPRWGRSATEQLLKQD